MCWMKVAAKQEPDRPSLRHRLEGENRLNCTNHAKEGRAVVVKIFVPIFPSTYSLVEYPSGPAIFYTHACSYATLCNAAKTRRAAQRRASRTTAQHSCEESNYRAKPRRKPQVALMPTKPMEAKPDIGHLTLELEGVC